jgi:hypothetical protein
MHREGHGCRRVSRATRRLSGKILPVLHRALNSQGIRRPKFIEAVKLETEKWLDGKNGQPAWLELRDVNSRARWKKW